MSGTEILALAVYLPPSMGRNEVRQVAAIVSDNISRIRIQKPNISIIVGGDLNGKKFTDSVADFPRVKKILTGPTRGKKKLDIIFTDIDVKNVSLLSPIETELGVPSDHKTILCEANLRTDENGGIGEVPDKFFYTRPLSQRGMERFSACLLYTSPSPRDLSTSRMPSSA